MLALQVEVTPVGVGAGVALRLICDTNLAPVLPATATTKFATFGGI